MTGIGDRLRSMPIFADVDDAALDTLASEVEALSVPAGTEVFAEGDEGDHAYVVLDGEVDITVFAPPHRVTLGTCATGDVLGEMSLLRSRRRSATATARTDATLAIIDRPTLDRIAAQGPARNALVRIVIDRLEETAARLEQAHRMAQLGTLTAGVAHELNNPASAVRRNVDTLDDQLARLLADAARLAASDAARVIGHIRDLPAAGPGGEEPDALERLDITARFQEVLAGAGVASAARLATELVAAGIDQGTLDEILDMAKDADVTAAVDLLAAWSTARRMTDEIGWAASQITEITSTLSSYSRIGRSPTSEVDVTEGLDQAVALLDHRLGRIDVTRDYEPDLPTVTGVASELNQVWTNLLANAADAAGPGGSIAIRTRADDEYVVVDVEDDGPGIPDEALPRIYDDFFTTKPPGAGTGLGLAISRRIVRTSHGGDITVDTQPGRTVFTVRLPR